jgi:hypothetical protein
LRSGRRKDRSGWTKSAESQKRKENKEIEKEIERETEIETERKRKSAKTTDRKYSETGTKEKGHKRRESCWTRPRCWQMRYVRAWEGGPRTDTAAAAGLAGSRSSPWLIDWLIDGQKRGEEKRRRDRRERRGREELVASSVGLLYYVAEAEAEAPIAGDGLGLVVFWGRGR